MTASRWKPAKNEVCLHVPVSTGQRATGPADDPDYATFGRASLSLKMHGLDLRTFHRLAFQVFPQCEGTVIMNLNATLENAKPTDVGAHLINLRPNQWNTVIFDLSALEREQVERITFYTDLKGRNQALGDTLSYTLRHRRLEQLEEVESDRGWLPPAGQISYSMSGYLPGGQKTALVGSTEERTFQLTDESGQRTLFSGPVQNTSTSLGTFGLLDFSAFQTPGRYRLRVGDRTTELFLISDDAFLNAQWRLLNFIFCQRCGYAVVGIHGLCHQDLFCDHNGQQICYGGGWHDAGDFDLRVESQAGEAYILALAYEAFHPEIDVTAIDQQKHTVEIHESDGKNDLLQQVENGALTVVRSYQALGRLYRGIICNNVRQYVLLGDASAMTDGKIGNEDDRWIFTEDNPMRALSTAAELAGASRVLNGFNDELARECLDIATTIFAQTQAEGWAAAAKLQAAVELYLTTEKKEYLDFVLDHQDMVLKGIGRVGWYTARLVQRVSNMKDKRIKRFVADFRQALTTYRSELENRASETPYGVPYRPSIWGAGWDIQRFGFEYYFLSSAYPDIFPKETVFNALNFVLGCHPGSNTSSFASGVGAKSATVAYGLNRADWSYIPGGVVSGTALIRPDFPELLEFPFLWQQMEYVLGGGSSHYMFLVLAARQFLKQLFTSREFRL